MAYDPAKQKKNQRKHEIDWAECETVFMSKKRTSVNTRKSDLPYDARDKTAVLSFWKHAVAHRGVAELRAKRGRPVKAEHERKEQIALRIDADVVAWYRALGSGWQTRMNAVLKAYRDATV